jgi:hypothetical protein
VTEKITLGHMNRAEFWDGGRRVPLYDCHYPASGFTSRVATIRCMTGSQCTTRGPETAAETTHSLKSLIIRCIGRNLLKHKLLRPLISCVQTPLHICRSKSAPPPNTCFVRAQSPVGATLLEILFVLWPYAFKIQARGNHNKLMPRRHRPPPMRTLLPPELAVAVLSPSAPRSPSLRRQPASVSRSDSRRNGRRSG